MTEKVIHAMNFMVLIVEDFVLLFFILRASCCEILISLIRLTTSFSSMTLISSCLTPKLKL